MLKVKLNGDWYALPCSSELEKDLILNFKKNKIEYKLN